jgi:hypothetical protein
MSSKLRAMDRNTELKTGSVLEKEQTETAKLQAFSA